MKAVNLIPSDQRRSTSAIGRSGGGAYAVLGVIGGLAIMAFLYGSADRQVSSRRTQAASLTARAQQAQADVAQLAPYTSFIALREQRLQAVSQLVNTRFDWAHSLHELGRVLPHDASLLSLSGSVGTTTPVSASSSASTTSTAVTSATPAGTVPTFTLDGCATNQAEVALTLQRLRLVDGVSEVTLLSSVKATPGSSTSSSAGSCPGQDPAFQVEVAFDPLPSVTTPTPPLAKLTSETGAAR